jgi:cysteine synthase A
MTTSGKVRTTDGRGKLFESILDTVGDTPAVRINNLGPDEVTIYVKAEFFNPAGSVKDRLALNIVEEAERSGVLRPGQTVVEASSGNTGIGLAMVCAQKGYPLVVVMPESFSVERRKLMRMYGAGVVLTPRADKAVGAYRKAAELADGNGWFLARQFETSANADIHESTTAREIVNDFAGSRLDWFVTGYGTGGTIVGVARLLRRERPETRIALSEPVNAQMIGSSVGQERATDGAPTASHPAWQPHAIEGWAPDFIPLVLQEGIDSSFFDEVVPVAAGDGVKWARALAAKEGILTGISGGSTFAAARHIAVRAPPGSVILCMLPDTGERYLSSSLFEGIESEMSDEERALSLSTPSAQYKA